MKRLIAALILVSGAAHADNKTILSTSDGRVEIWSNDDASFLVMDVADGPFMAIGVRPHTIEAEFVIDASVMETCTYKVTNPAAGRIRFVLTCDEREPL